MDKILHNSIMEVKNTSRFEIQFLIPVATI